MEDLSFSVTEPSTALPAAIDEVDRSIREVGQVLEAEGLQGVSQAVTEMVAAIRALKPLLPKDLKRPNGAFRGLQRHARFVELYLDRQNERYVRSNLASLHNDAAHLRAELAPSMATPIGDLGINVEQLPEGPPKCSLKEAIKNYLAGAFGSAIVSAVNALEGYLRSLRQQRLNINAGRGKLVDVLDDLEKGSVLTKAEAPLAQLVRLYRNYAAHPSGFVAAAEDARMVIQFVFRKLKSQ